MEELPKTAETASNWHELSREMSFCGGAAANDHLKEKDSGTSLSCSPIN